MKLRTEALTLRKRDGNVSDSPTSSTKFDKSSRSLSLPSIDPSVACDRESRSARSRER